MNSFDPGQKRNPVINPKKIIRNQLKPEEVILWQEHPIGKRLVVRSLITVCICYPLGLLALLIAVMDIYTLFVSSGEVETFMFAQRPARGDRNVTLDLSVMGDCIVYVINIVVALMFAFVCLFSPSGPREIKKVAKQSMYAITNKRTFHFDKEEVDKGKEEHEALTICSLGEITDDISIKEKKDGSGCLEFTTKKIVDGDEEEDCQYFEHIPNVRKAEEILRQAIADYKAGKQG